MPSPAKTLPVPTLTPSNPTTPPLNLLRWVEDNRESFLPPVGNKQLFPQSPDVILFVSAGPNTRNDYHVNPTEELFYQLRGDIVVRIRPLETDEPEDVVVREGEVFLLPRWVPHRPQRPAGTLGLIAEFPRPEGQNDGLRWYCPKCDALVHEASFRLKKIDEDLHRVMNDFWDGPAGRRTCGGCGYVITRAPEFVMPPHEQRAASRKRKTRNAKAAKRSGGRKVAKSTVSRASSKKGAAATRRTKGSRTRR